MGREHEDVAVEEPEIAKSESDKHQVRQSVGAGPGEEDK